MTKLEFAKKATSFLVGLGTSKITGDIIRNNAQPRNMFDTINIALASATIGSMAAIATKEHTETMIDEAVDVIQKLKNN